MAGSCQRELFPVGIDALPDLIQKILNCHFIGIMWPGSISISSQIMPRGGTAMFAMLALGGDLGGTLGPSIVGNISQRFGNDLRVGVLSAIGFPIVLVISVLIVRRMRRRQVFA